MEATKKVKKLADWTLLNFARTYGSHIEVGECVSKSGVKFATVSFGGNGGSTKYAHFGPSVGQLTYPEVIAKARNLWIMEVEVKPEILQKRKEEGKQEQSYIIYEKGSNSSWVGGDLFEELGLK